MIQQKLKVRRWCLDEQLFSKKIQTNVSPLHTPLINALSAVLFKNGTKIRNYIEECIEHE